MADDLHEHQQKAVLELLHNGHTQEEVASLYGISRWAVRKLAIAGRPQKQRLSQEDHDLLEVARATGLNAAQLQHALTAAPLTDRNVYRWLITLPHERLARLFYQVHLAQEAHRQSQGHTHAASPEIG